MPKHNAFIIHPTYEIIEDKAMIILYGRLDDGRSFMATHKTRPYFYIRSSDVKLAKKLGSFDAKEVRLKNFSNENVTKIIVDVPRQIPPLRDAFINQDIPCYEADIRFEYRYLIDEGLRGTCIIEGEEKRGLSTDVLFEEPKIEPVEKYPKELRVLSFDIETSKETNKLYAISIATNKGYEKVLILSERNDLKKAESFLDETELLQRFIAIVQELDPDVITGWNVIDFDLANLQERFRRHKIPFALGRGGSLMYLRRSESFFRDSKADAKGRLVLDGIQLLKNNFIKLDNYKLNTAAAHFLGEKKIFEGSDRYKQIDDAYENNQQLLVDYNLKDAQLVLDVLDKSGAFELTVKRSMLTGMPLDRVSASIASLDQLYLHELKKRGYVAVSSSYREREQRTIGGYVMQSTPGIYDYVLVCDFKSLYPSIMRTFNIDPLMYNEPGDDNDIIAPNGAHFRRERGIMPGIIGEILKRRDAARKAGDELQRFALKILMNSFYGVNASPNCRFYSPMIANAITSFARHFIQMLEKRFKEQGFDVIYGDTDSLFIDLKETDEESANARGKELVRQTNTFLNAHIKSEYGVESFLELEFEKVFTRFLMPRARHGDAGAKKRYAGMLVKDGKERLEFVGLEVVRRDWTEGAKEFQQELLDRIFHKKEVDGFVQNFVKEIKEGKRDKEIVYRKAIRKDLKEYTKTTPPHVKAARMLPSIESNIIEYVVTVDGPQPISMQKAAIDYEHYIEKQIKPIANTLLVFSNRTFEDIVKGSTQTSLGGF